MFLLGSNLSFASYKWYDIGIIYLFHVSGPQFLHLEGSHRQNKTK